MKRSLSTIPVVSEENPDEQNRAIVAAHSTYWIVDQLDGTQTFIDGFRGFGVHIGLIENGVPVTGVVYFPALMFCISPKVAKHIPKIQMPHHARSA